MQYDKVVDKILAGGGVPPKVREQLLELGLAEREINFRSALLLAAAQKGMTGDLRSIEYLFSLGGGEESESYGGLPAHLIGRDFVDVYRDILARGHRHYDFRGGRGSLKSSFAALAFVDDLQRHPEKCGLCLRQVGDTLRDSVFAQILWALDLLGLSGVYDCTVSPMKCQNRVTGQIIYFRGGNEPDKIKSIKPPKDMYIGVLWYEEADQFAGEAAMRSINQSVLRGGEDFLVFRTYNTPVSRRHFLNLPAGEERLCHHSCYLSAPREWLGNAFFEEAEVLRKRNLRAYQHEYLGKATGTGHNVFENVRERAITQEEMEGFDRVFYGLDWGWYPHPTAFVECALDEEAAVLYIFGERCCHKTGNALLAEILQDYKNVPITADTGGGGTRCIADLCAMGFWMLPARKGPGSIQYGIRRLQALAEIVIDPQRCPQTARQFSLYEYLKDRQGAPITGYPDSEDDFIDAVRYALEAYWRAS